MSTGIEARGGGEVGGGLKGRGSAGRSFGLGFDLVSLSTAGLGPRSDSGTGLCINFVPFRLSESELEPVSDTGGDTLSRSSFSPTVDSSSLTSSPISESRLNCVSCEFETFGEGPFFLVGLTFGEAIGLGVVIPSLRLLSCGVPGAEVFCGGV